MQTIFFVRDNELFLNSSLSEELFAKTKFSLLLDETGWKVSRTENNDFSFSKWRFTGTKTLNNEVFFTAPDFSGKNADDIICTSTDNTNLLFSLIQIFETAAKKDIPLPCNGPSGIIYESSTETFIFAPEKVFEKCSSNLGKDFYKEIQGNWKDNLLEGNSSLLFCSAILSYFALTKKMPLPYEKNYLPVEYAVNGVNANLAQSINNNLLGTKKSPLPLDELKIELFSNESQKHRIPDEKFEKKVTAFTTKQQNTQKRKRFFNRYTSTGISLIALLFFITITGISIHKSYMKKPCMRGLESKQVVKAFYSGLHHMDTDIMEAAEMECPAAKRYIMQIPQIYVSTQMKSAYNFDSGISTPENWLFFEPDTKKSYSHYVFGITNFTIDGEKSILNDKIPQRKDRIPRLSKNPDGTKLYPGEEANHSVHYNLVHTVGDELIIDEYTTNLSLTYKKDSWQITEMKENCSTTKTGLLEFSLDYKESLAHSNGNIPAAADHLRIKHTWLPYTESILEENARLDAIGY